MADPQRGRMEVSGGVVVEEGGSIVVVDGCWETLAWHSRALHPDGDGVPSQAKPWAIVVVLPIMPRE